MNKNCKRDLVNTKYGTLSRAMTSLKRKMETATGDNLKTLRREFRKTLRERMKHKKYSPNPL